MSLTGIAFVLFYAFGLLRAFMSHPRWGLYTYVATFYLHPPMRWWGSALPDLRWSLTAALVTLVAMPNAKLPPQASPWSSLTVTKLMLIYGAWMWVQTIWARPGHVDGAILVTKYIILTYLIYRLVTDEKGMLDFAFAHVAGCFYFGLLTLDASSEGRLEYIGGPGVNDSNTLGMHVTTGLLFAASLIFALKGWRRWAVIGSVPILANCVLQTESRGAFLGALCGGLAYYYFAPKTHRKYVLSFGTICVFILLAYAPATYWERMSTIKQVTTEENEIDTSTENRLVLIKAQWEMFKDYPFGLGFDTTTYLSRRYIDVRWLSVSAGYDVRTYGGRSSHNTVMSVLCDQGLPGIILVGIGIITVAGMMFQFKAIRLRPEDRAIELMRASICASLVTVLVSGLFTNYIKAEVQIWCLGLLASGLQLARRRAVAR